MIREEKLDTTAIPPEPNSGGYLQPTSCCVSRRLSAIRLAPHQRMTDGRDDLRGQVVIVGRAVKNRKSDEVIMRTREASTMGFSPPNIAANSVRNRVRQMQGMTEIDRGIEALEAVAAIAASGRSSFNMLSPNAEVQNRSGNAAAGEERMLFHSNPPTSSNLRSTGRGMAALGVTASRRTSWSNVPFSRLSGGTIRASPTLSPSPRARSLVRVGSDLSTASSQEPVHRHNGPRLSLDSLGIDDDRDRNANAAATATTQEREAAADQGSDSSNDDTASAATTTSPKRFISTRDTIGAIFPRRHSKNSSRQQLNMRSAPSSSRSTSSRRNGGKKSSSSSSSRPCSAGPKPGSLQTRMSPQARGFSAIMWHDSFTPPGEEGVSPRGGDGQGRLKARGGWWARSSSATKGDHHMKGDDRIDFERGGVAREGEEDGGPKRAFSSPVGMRVENAQMRMENRRLEEALSAAKVRDTDATLLYLLSPPVQAFFFCHHFS